MRARVPWVKLSGMKLIVKNEGVIEAWFGYPHWSYILLRFFGIKDLTAFQAGLPCLKCRFALVGVFLICIVKD